MNIITAARSGRIRSSLLLLLIRTFVCEEFKNYFSHTKMLAEEVYRGYSTTVTSRPGSGYNIH